MRPSSSLPRALVAASLASVAWCSPALSQWSLSAEVGADRFWGGAVENTAGHRSLRPYRPTTFGIGVERRRTRVGAALRLRYASAGLALEGADAVTALKGIFTVYCAAPEIIYRVTTVGSDNMLLLHAGPLFEVWSVSDEDSQTRIGVQVAASLRVPLGGRVAASLAAGAALTPSPFGRDQLGESFELRALWRRRVAVGVEYRL